MVDDDLEDQEFFQAAVSMAVPGINLVSEIDSEKALGKLLISESLPDLIFLDINMPKMDGFAFITQIKKEVVLKDIPVVFYSTTSHSEQIEKAFQLGASGFVTKTHSFRDLCKIVGDYANKSSVHLIS